MEERMEYYRSQIVPSDSRTRVYWAERHDGENFDIHPSDIPDGEIVRDVTYAEHMTIYYIKKGTRFIKQIGS